MQHNMFKRKLNENGFSLLEVVASLVLLSIILLSFSYLIINTLKTTKSSERIVDYTYYAQTEMEKIYALNSKNLTLNFDNKKNLIINEFFYTEEPEVGGLTILQRNDEANIYYRIKMKSNEDYSELTNLIIEVFDQQPDTSRSPKAHMETILQGGS